MIAHLDGKEHLFEDGAPYNIVNISDFNSLVALSQAHKTPVFSLTEEQLNKTGSVKNTMAANRDNFYKVFEKFTDSVVGLTQER